MEHAMNNFFWEKLTVGDGLCFLAGDMATQRQGLPKGGEG